MLRPAAPLLLALLLVPAAAGCSLASSPVGPGYIWLHDADGTLLRTIEVRDQDLGADCSLANIVGLTSRHLAWRDGGRTHLLDLATMQTSIVEAPARSSGLEQVLLTEDGFVTKTFEWDGNMSNSTWTLHRWDGSTLPLPLPRSWAYLAWHDGEHAVVQTREAARSNVTTWIHDLATGAAVAGPFSDQVVAGGPDWSVRSEGNRLVFDGTTMGSVEAGFHARITKEGAWTQEWADGREESRLRLLAWNGDLADGFSTRGSLLAATSTHVATGAYALEWRDDPFDQFAASPVGLSIGLLLLALADLRRRR